MPNKSLKSSINLAKNFAKHFFVIVKHKYYVGIECWKRGLYWQGIIHDLSKFSFAEFIPSALYFQGNGSPIDKQRAEIGYSISWLNHKAKNKHHWHYWLDIDGGKIITVPIPRKYLLEMVCDFIGAGKAYNGKNYTPEEPLKFFNKVRGTWFIDKQSEVEFEKELKKLIK